MTRRADESGRGGRVQEGHPVAATRKQKTLFPIQPTEPWRILSSERLQLDKEKYDRIRECYRVVLESFLPGRVTVPFYKQVSERLKTAGLNIGSQTLARLVSRARDLGIDHFPDPRPRAVSSASPDAAKLQSPLGSVRMSMDAHNAFAEVYRDLLRTWRKSRQAGKRFFAQAAARMRERGHVYTDKQLALYAHLRRRIGDVNFPRVGGSRDIERMQIAAVERMRLLGEFFQVNDQCSRRTVKVSLVVEERATHRTDEFAGKRGRQPLEKRCTRVIDQASQPSDLPGDHD